MDESKEYVVDKLRKLKGRTFRALLGQGDSGETVNVSGKANYVWIRVKYGSELGSPVQALNRHVPPIHGRIVRVREIDRAGIKGYEIIDFDDTGSPYYHDDTEAVMIPAHGHTHECSQDAYGTDPVNLYPRGWAALRVEPTDPCSMYCYVTRGWYLCEELGWFAGGNTPAFTAPTLERTDLVYIDCSGTIGIETGEEALPGFSIVPEPPDFTIPLGAIQMTGTTGCIGETMILDCRVMPNLKMPAGGARFDDSVGPSAVMPVNWCGDDEFPSRRDHWHQGLRSISEAGQSALYNDVTLSEGSNIVLTQAGQDIDVAVNTSPTFINGTFTGDVTIQDDLTVEDHAWMLTGTVGQDFDIHGELNLLNADVDEPFVKFIGTAAAADVTRSLVDVGDVTTATLAGYVKVEIQDDGNQITDDDYYMPVYTLT